MLEQELTSGLTAPGMYSSYSVFSIKYSHLPTVHSLLVEKSRTSTSRPASYVCKTMKIYDFQQVFSSVSLRTKPPCQEGSGSLPVGGFAARGYFTEYSQNIINLVHKAPAPHPPTRRDTPLPGRLPLCTVGRDQKP